MKIPERICLFCKQFVMSPGCEGFSDITPGWDMSIYCKLNHWEVKVYWDNDESYRRKLLKAVDCKDWEILDGYEEKAS